MKSDLFQSCGHCWVFQICWHIECSTFTASSFRIWNSSTGIPSPSLALFLVMLSKAHLTSHLRMSGYRWVITLSLRVHIYFIDTYIWLQQTELCKSHVQNSVSSCNSQLSINTISPGLSRWICKGPVLPHHFSANASLGWPTSTRGVLSVHPSLSSINLFLPGIRPRITHNDYL